MKGIEARPVRAMASCGAAASIALLAAARLAILSPALGLRETGTAARPVAAVANAEGQRLAA